MSMLTNIVDTLTAAGISAYMPGKHEGKCLSAYVMAADGGVIRTGKTTGRHIYQLYVYVPMDRPSTLTAQVASVRDAVKTLTSLRQTGDQSPDMIDEELGAYCVTLEYSALCSA